MSVSGAGRHAHGVDILHSLGSSSHRLPREDLPLREQDDTDQARAAEYALLASVLLHAPSAETLARLTRLQGTPTPLGLAHIALAEAAAGTSAATLQREYFDLFIGVGRGELLPYASYYRTGFLHDLPLAKLRGDLQRLGLERADGHPDPEDHLGTLFEIMSLFAAGSLGSGPDEERIFFDRHLAAWAGRFFADLETAKAASFYRAVGMVGRVFMEIEAEAFAIDAQTGDAETGRIGESAGRGG
jgi:TorA maturation chaperone TorD